MNVVRNFCLPLLMIVVFLSSCQEQEKPLTLKDSKIPTYNKIEKEQQIKDRYEQEKDMTKDPVTGIVPTEQLVVAQKNMFKQQKDLLQKTAIPNVVWNEIGPNNVGGRTRTIMWDPNDPTHRKVWAGGVGGGVWYNNDITTASSQWQVVDDFWANMAVTSMDSDPINTNTFYAGTGEGFYNIDAIQGDGVWKSTDGGSTWNQLPNTTSFVFVNKLLCFKANHIMVASHQGLRRSTDGGNTWVTERSGRHADVEVAANGDLYASDFSGNIYKSTDDGANWSNVRSGGGNRIELATAPSDASYVYALVNTGSNVTDILKTENGGTTWLGQTVPLYKEQGTCEGASNPFTRGQGWYDLIAIVHPTDPERVIIGGIDLYRTTDGGINWETISYWTGACDDYVHADQHALAVRPGFPDAILNGNDGGIFYASNAFGVSTNPDFQERNNEYNVTQFYAVAVHPDNTITNILAGAQDNGTKRLTQNSIGPASNVTGGDGAFCHIDQDQPNYQITSYVYNNFYISTNGTSFPSYSVGNTGRFINPTDYDNDANILYACKGSNEYLIVEGIGGTLSNSTKSVSEFGGQVSCIRVSPNVANRVYFGINSNGGKIVRVDNANTTPVVTELGTTANGYVSSIDVEVGNEDHLLVTLSNYNLNSVWESTNGGTSFSSVEGDLPNMPVRWGIFDPNNSAQAILATELGVWTTTMLDGSSTDWDPTNSGLANVRVDMIEYRASDNFMVAGTHGRGVFTSTSFNLGCNIDVTSIGAQVCDENTNTYSQEITIDMLNIPATGQISINGQLFNIPNGSASSTQTFTLVNLVADSQPVDVSIFYTADNSCQKDYTGLFNAANPGCVLDNNVCSMALPITSDGTYTSNGPGDGNGCNNCSNSAHADWYKFTAPSNGTITIQSCGYGVDTRMYVYSGECNSLTAVASSDDDCFLNGNSGNEYASQVENVPVTSGTTYYWEWDNRWNTSAVTFDFSFEAAASPCEGLVYRIVDPSLPSSGDGCTWASAFNNLQDAIDAVGADNSLNEIWLKAGTYKPGGSAVTPDRNTTISVPSTMTIYGGFAGTETSLNQRDPSANVSFISGDVGVVNVEGDNSIHIISHNSSSGTLTLDGVRIVDGNNNVNTTGGAGIYNQGVMVLVNCQLNDHMSISDGSAITNTGVGAELTIEGSTSTSSNIGVDIRNQNGAEITVSANSSVGF